jgi:murein DD-endopeptidase MepM/ murein hydrolase activator NlpD
MVFRKIWPIQIRKNFLTRWFILLLVIGSVLLLAAAGQPSVTITAPPLQATPTASPNQAERPFQLPFAGPPGLATWLVGQPYGNTTGAYRQRFTTYGASGGIHFGLDLSAPCGTEIVAIADGVVFAVDGPFGSPPHNLMVDHPDLGYASLYGHLLEAPDLVPGQRVQQGEVIALSGSSRSECPRGAHLHLEIRDLNHVRKYNPLLLIEANWNNLTLVSSSGISFMRNLDAPRQWQTLYDQPEVFTGGPIVNDFARPWPFDWSKNTATTSPPLGGR